MYRTDMAVESLNGRDTGCEIKTVKYRGGILRTDVRIKTDGAAKRLNKPKGFYSTVESADGIFTPGIKEKAAEALSKALTDCLTPHLPAAADKGGKLNILAAGLGNPNMTADSLGPRVCKKLIITRHLPNDNAGRLQTLSAISPGVLGITGIETYDVIYGLTQKIMPDAIITVDSLAARSVPRLAKAFQVTDTGISPGSGVDNHRFRLDKNSLNVPVIAIGVPLVVYAKTIADDIIAEYTARQKTYKKHNASAYKAHTIMKETAAAKDTDNETNEKETIRNAIMDSILSSTLGDLIVTPKDIDQIVKDCADIIATAINMSVHNLTVKTATELMK